MALKPMTNLKPAKPGLGVYIPSPEPHCAYCDHILTNRERSDGACSKCSASITYVVWKDWNGKHINIGKK